MHTVVRKKKAARSWRDFVCQSAAAADLAAAAGCHRIRRAVCDQVNGQTGHEALGTAIAGVVEQHEILRTSFQRQPGMRTPVQVICEQPTVSWHESDLINHDATSKQREIRVICEADKRAKTLESDNSGAVLRVSVLRLAAEDHVLVLTLPSLCADYRSLSLLTAKSHKPTMNASAARSPLLICCNMRISASGKTSWRRATMPMQGVSFGWANKKVIRIQTFRLSNRRFEPASRNV